MTAPNRVRIAAWLTALSLLLGLGAVQPAAVSAHGLHGAERQVYVGPAGPFDARVRSTTAVGEVHVTVFVTERATGVQTPDAAVSVSLRDAAGERAPVGPEQASSVIVGSNAYTAVLFVEEPGVHVLTGRIVGPAAAAEGTFETRVSITRPGSGVNWGLVAVLLALAAFALWPFRRRRARSRRVGGGGPATDQTTTG